MVSYTFNKKTKQKKIEFLLLHSKETKNKKILSKKWIGEINQLFFIDFVFMEQKMATKVCLTE